jgi:hypothetical protein
MKQFSWRYGSLIGIEGTLDTAGKTLAVSLIGLFFAGKLTAGIVNRKAMLSAELGFSVGADG